MLSLRELQRRFLAALAVDVGDVDAAAPSDPLLLQAVNGSGRLDAAERLGIYAGMYRTRLLDALREDFPRTLAVVGQERFTALAWRYVRRFPSTTPSIRHLGERFAHSLGGEPTVPAFVPDLARLEWARVEVFDAADVAPLALADLQSLPADAWPALRLALIPACLVVESEWPVHRIWAAGEATLADWAPEATTVRVWREGWSVSHAALGLTERQAFRALQARASFGEICAAVDTHLGADADAREMGGILMRWLEDGLLARPEPPA